MVVCAQQMYDTVSHKCAPQTVCTNRGSLSCICTLVKEIFMRPSKKFKITNNHLQSLATWKTKHFLPKFLPVNCKHLFSFKNKKCFKNIKVSNTYAYLKNCFLPEFIYL